MIDPGIEYGLYFGLPEEEYHAIPALSASGIKNLLISPTDFYYRSWLNAEKEDVESEALVIGKAYHKRILEGRAAFEQAYCPTFSAPDGCLKTIDEIKAALQAAGVDTPTKWKKADYVLAAQQFLPDAKIFDIELARYDAETQGRVQLSPDLIGRIEIAAAMIEMHPQLNKCFSGGFPEVTVIWEMDGIPFKSRFDYLKPAAVVDLKTFTNTQNKPVDLAIYSAMASFKYHIQASLYLIAATEAAKFAKAGKVFGPDLAQVSDDWLQKLAGCKDHRFIFVFQQKGIAPLARGKWFKKGSIHACALASIESATATFKRCYEAYGDAPWVDASEITDLEDELFPVYATEI